MNIPGWIWAATIALYTVLFVIDLLVVGRRPHIPSTAECVRWLSLYIGIAIAARIPMMTMTKSSSMRLKPAAPPRAGGAA